jgi:hypothetical protein
MANFHGGDIARIQIILTGRLEKLCQAREKICQSMTVSS